MKVKKNFMAILIMVSVICFAFPLSSYAEEWLRASYDGRNEGVITPVQDQGSSDLCWAYSAVGAAEASILKSKVESETSARRNILSPTQIGYACQNRGSDPLGNTSGVKNNVDYLHSKGSTYYAASLFSQWCGPVGYGLGDNCNGWENAKYRLMSSSRMDLNDLNDLKENAESRLAIKKAIVKYGGVTFSYNNARESEYYNPQNETGSDSYSHACVIIGWDDDIPASYFNPGGASQNGGWLIKNSYSSLPYFYLSYDNSSSNVYTFSFAPKEKYDNNYFYDSEVADFGVGSLIRPRNAANIFEAKMGSEKNEECVSAVNVGIDGGSAKINVKVYTDINDISDPTSGKLAATEYFEPDYSGYYTIDLSNPPKVEKGSYFSVVAEILSGSNAYITLSQNNGNSFINKGSGWNNALGTPRIKAYTKMINKKIEFSNSKVLIDVNEYKGKTLILACFDDKYFTGAKLFSVNESSEGSFDIPKNWEKKKGCKIKAMLWENTDNMIPICSEEIEWE